MACGPQWARHFSDIGFVSAGKRRGFCRLRRRKVDQAGTDAVPALVTLEGD
jgi:hypothetical protein